VREARRGKKKDSAVDVVDKVFSINRDGLGPRGVFNKIDELTCVIDLSLFVSNGHVFHSLSYKSNRRIQRVFLGRLY
jgi:hypothetical protein